MAGCVSIAGGPSAAHASGRRAAAPTAPSMKRGNLTLDARDLTPHGTRNEPL
jgi:hypothetical protein